MKRLKLLYVLLLVSLLSSCASSRQSVSDTTVKPKYYSVTVYVRNAGFYNGPGVFLAGVGRPKKIMIGINDGSYPATEIIYDSLSQREYDDLLYRLPTDQEVLSVKIFHY